jgi:beta-phosphoglucomutase-like phosphatase (HAD superfamily)
MHGFLWRDVHVAALLAEAHNPVRDLDRDDWPTPPERAVGLSVCNSGRRAHHEHRAAAAMRDTLADAAERVQPLEPAAPDNHEVGRLGQCVESVDWSRWKLLELGADRTGRLQIDVPSGAGDEPERRAKAGRKRACGIDGGRRLERAVHPDDDRPRPRLHAALSVRDQNRARGLVQQVGADEAERDAGREAVAVRADHGNTMVAEQLRAKPAPDTLFAACRQLRVEPQHAAAFETSPAGVAAARAAGFALVVGVDQTGHPEGLRANGADLVVAGLGELLEERLAA